ncbi:MAG: hypothetical protein ETSY2_32390 [Candidatus Entotheonella gemina]|uniref:Uncharacterized protein n=1 Tax=Candidatus Entotheonella gemina TaxID=1429439 RepID=W4M1L4_9BACT|nr:MAG: hypothetical protein ETSY2_32390 [Candidatus Entotheonella gemina]
MGEIVNVTVYVETEELIKAWDQGNHTHWNPELKKY